VPRAELRLKQIRDQAGDCFVKLVCKQGAARCSLLFGWWAISLLLRKNDTNQCVTAVKENSESSINMKLRHDGGFSLFAQTTDGMR
jgi:hypothetical protein